jgi:hypothetical protein
MATSHRVARGAPSVRIRDTGFLEAVHGPGERPPGLPSRSRADFVRWQATERRRLRALLGLGNLPLAAPSIERKLVKRLPEYSVERLRYHTLPGLAVPAFLLVPRGLRGTAPAVLCPPGHGHGMRQLMDEKPGIYKQYPRQLACRGFVVLVPEHAGFGERADRPGGDTHSFLAHALALLGRSWIGLVVRELMRAVDVLRDLPEVDPRRVGCFGLSLGGESTLYLSALDARIAAAVISGFVTSFRSTFLAEPHCSCGYSFEVARWLEHGDLASLIAPRSVLVESGTRDRYFPVGEARRTVRGLRRAWRLLGDERGIVHDVFEGGHEIGGALAFDWLQRVLGRP